MTPDAVLDFWFGADGSAAAGTVRPEWFRKDAAFDAAIAERFGAWIDAALDSGLFGGSTNAEASLARILLLDQFTRNAFRGTARSFAGDALALAEARAMVAAQRDLALPTLARWFVYLPFEHAEDLAIQDDAVRRMEALAELDPRLAEAADYARKHRDVIARFGRFPHRNVLLGRASTAEEVDFLKQPGSSF